MEQAKVNEIIQILARLHLPPDPGLSMTVRIDLTGAGGGCWTLAIAGGAIQPVPGKAGLPTTSIRLPARMFVEMMHGAVDSRALEARGLMQVKGQPGAVTALVSLYAGALRGGRTSPPTGRMTGRQRIMAALRKQPVDRLPFTPLIDNYFLLDSPPAIPKNTIEAARKLGVDIVLRHVPILSWSSLGFLGALGSFRSPVSFKVVTQGGQVVEKIVTPKGTLTGVSAYTGSVGFIPHPLKHAVETGEDLKVFHYAVDHLEHGDLGPAYEGFSLVDRAIGDDGIATPSLNNSPLLHFVETVSGLTHVYYLMQDHPEEMDEILQKLARHYLKVVEAMAESPAEVVIAYENTSTTLISPGLFRRYCLPYLDASADILHRRGKIHLVHMCGKLFHLREDIAAGRYDGIVDVAPAPTGDLPLDQALAAVPGKSVMGGIDATTFVSGDRDAVRAEVSRTIERVKPHRGVLLGSGDSVPRGASLENLRLITELVESIGTY